MMKQLFLKGGKRSMMLAMFLMLAMVTFAVPAKPGLKRVLTLSDGTTVSAVLVGDEHGHFWKGADGKSYQMIAGSDTFQEVNSQEIIEKAKQKRAKANQRRMRRMAPQKVGNVGSITGQKKGLIILVNYTDVTFKAANNKALYQRIANEENFTYTVNSSYSFKGSMYDYFKAQSEGLFELTFDVVGPVTVSNTQAYYGGNDSNGDDKHPAAMVIEAINLADGLGVNFADYDWDGDKEVDQVYVIYAGNGEADSDVDDSIWPHEWTLSSANYYGDGTGSLTLDGVKIDTYACGGELNGNNVISGIGTMCHEFSHCLGYPDFYDTDYSGGQGMGYWDLMDSGSYNDDGYQPSGYTSYERWVAGWKEPTELTYTQSIINMKALQTIGSDAYIIYNNGNKNEYFLLENRQQTGWDTSLPGEGLLILHVDYSSSVWSNNKPNDDPDRQRMTWIAADNNYQYTMSNGTKYYSFSGMANDPFPYGSVNAFNKNTTPAAKFYNKNSDNTYYLDSSVENITQNSDGTITFNFVGVGNVYMPNFSPDGGRYTETQTVTLSCTTSGATIRYTLDGSTPTSSSTVYSSPITISQTTTIKAIAIKNNEQSAVATATYTIVDPYILADETLTFNTSVGTPQTKQLEVLSEALRENITLALTDPSGVFSLGSNTISRTEEDAFVDVTFTPTAVGNYSGSITLTSAGADPVTVQLSATAKEPSTSNPSTTTFKRVTSTDNLQSGMRYIIGCGSAGKAAGALSSQIMASVDVTVNDDVITKTNDVAVFVLEGNQTDGWTFKNESSNQYLYATAVKKLAYDSTANTWTLSNGTAGVIMTYCTSSYGTMLCNNSSGSERFTTYTSTPTASMIQANLYMEYSDGGTTPVVKQDVTMAFTPATATATMGQSFTAPTLSTTPSGLTVSYSSSNTNVATVNSSTGEITLVAAGETTITATFAGNDSYNSGTASYTLTVNAAQSSSSNQFTLINKAADFVEGDYIIVYDGGAMNTTVSSNRLQYTEVNPSNNVITTTDASIIWHIAQSGSYYTIYNSDKSKYAAATGSNNQAQLLASGTDDKSLWSVTTGSTFDFKNKSNSRYLRRNGTYGFACYADGTGGKLSLYKRTSGSSSTTVEAPTISGTTPFDNSTTVTISAETGASIYYTLDGNTPTSSSTLYSTPFTLTATTTVKAIAVKNEVSSSVATKEFVRNTNTTIDYYQNADNTKGSALKTAMFGIISSNRTNVSYDNLWSCFTTTDRRSDGKVWDMYSNITNFTFGDDKDTGSGDAEGQYYNREHSFPQSWFGEGTPMKSDLHHVYPTDKFVNGKRSNYPFGKTSSPTWSSENGFSKLGPCSVTGYSGTVFEPADEYKGDFARTYFYMVTCYENSLSSWCTSNSSIEVTVVLDGNKYPGLSEWQLNMLMEWAKNDPVSEKETNRNNAVYAIQNNRNPFIDYPGLQEYVWGNLTTESFSYDNYLKPVNMYFSASTATATAGETFTAPSLTVLPDGLTVTYSSSDEDVATVDASTGVVTPVAAGTTTITATYSGSENYIGSASYTLTVSEAIVLPSMPDDVEISSVRSTSITVSWEATMNATSYDIDVVQGSSFESSTGSPVLQSDFSDTTGWILSGTGTYTGADYYGAGSPSIKFDGTDDYAISPDFGSGVKLQFWAYGNNGSGSTFAIKGLVNGSWTDIETVSIDKGGATYEVNLPSGTSQVRFDFTKSVNCALDDVVVYGLGNNPVSLNGYPKSVGNETSYTITGLTPDTQYAVRLRAVNSAGNSEWSSTLTATTSIANSAPVWSAFPNASVTVGEDYDLMISDYVSGNPTPTISMTASTANSADYEYDSDGGYFLFVPSEAGTFSFTFTATNSEGSANATLSITVTQPPVTVPTLAVTEADITATSAPVTWNACDGVSSYTLQLASDDQFSTGGSGSSVTLVSNDATDTTAPTDWTYNIKNSSGSYLQLMSGNYVITEAFNASSCTDLELSLYIRTYGGTTYPSITVQYSTDNGSTWSNSLGTLSAANTTMAKRTLDISAAAGNSSVRLRIASTSTSNSVGVGIKTIVIAGTEAAGGGSLISTTTVDGTSYTFTGLSPETIYYARVKGDAGWSDVESFTTNTAITFANNADNSSAISTAAQTGKRYDATLASRTLYKDGAWNTLCLPFDMTAAQVTAQLAPTSLMELDNSNTLYNNHKTGIDGSTLYLNFKDATSITAGTPYIIKWTGDGTNNLVNPTFTGVVMGNSATPTDIESTDGSVAFKGVYAPVNLAKDDKTNLYLGGGNNLYWPNVDNYYVNAFRAYFKLSEAASAREFVLNFGDEETTTGIFENEELRMRNEELEDGIYDLQGRKMVNGQLKRGVYIVNGKKVVIK